MYIRIFVCSLFQLNFVFSDREIALPFIDIQAVYQSNGMTRDSRKEKWGLKWKVIKCNSWQNIMMRKQHQSGRTAWALQCKVNAETNETWMNPEEQRSSIYKVMVVSRPEAKEKKKKWLKENEYAGCLGHVQHNSVPLQPVWTKVGWKEMQASWQWTVSLPAHSPLWQEIADD